ncbi:hypothetical protein ACFFQF_30440 [Haladaptatus pallidirubidus]|uniref:hypothetical protein n=1 Tax=Haladaptatus pallidirubidus TaxID=1008152 RepID=UPI001D11A7D7|nr:hypothetical protein [Haladaptatus pallidirubidus]
MVDVPAKVGGRAKTQTMRLLTAFDIDGHHIVKVVDKLFSSVAAVERFFHLLASSKPRSLVEVPSRVRLLIVAYNLESSNRRGAFLPLLDFNQYIPIFRPEYNDVLDLDSWWPLRHN